MTEEVETTEGSSEATQIGPDAVLEKISRSSHYLHLLIAILSCSWGAGAVAVMSSSFYDLKNTTMVPISEEFEMSAGWGVHASSFFMFGAMGGGLITSFLADRVGRRPVALFCSFGLAVMFIPTSLAPNIECFVVARFLHGVFYTGSGQSAWVLAFELAPYRWRPAKALLFGFGWVAGYCLVLPLSMIAGTWRQFMLLCSVPVFIYFILVLGFVPESLHWLVIKGKQKKIEKQWMARLNEPLLSIQARSSLTESAPKISLCSVIGKNSRMIGYVAAVASIWLVDSFIYFGLSLHSTHLSGDYHINYIAIGLIEIPAYYLANMALDKWSRRVTMFATHFIAAAACAGNIVAPSEFTVFFSMLCKMCITVTYMNIYVMGSELFPTKLRNSAIGFCGIISRFGAILAPQLNNFEQYENLPNLAFITFAAIAGSLACFLPETKGKKLDESISEESKDEEKENVEATA